MSPTLQRWARRRARLVATSLAAGALLGITATVGYAAAETPLAAERLVFALGTLALGFGTLGWSGSVMAGRGIETMQDHLDVARGWSERDSRRAMTRVAMFGLGLMVGASVAAPLL